MLQAAIDNQIRASVVMVDHSAVYAYQTPAEVGKTLLEWLYERVSMHLEPAGENCIIIADKPGGGAAEERKWLADTLELTNDGTQYVRPGRVVLPIVTAHSHHVPHLQLADLVTASATAAVAGRPAGLELREFLKKLFIRNTFANDAGGVGIKIYPDRRNLYYWVFGETQFSRWGTLQFEKLPMAGYLYETDDGMS